MRADEVAHYLQNNPQFFEQYADLMAQIAIPHPHGGRAISITERQMLTLRDKNRQLEAKLGELIGFGEENDAISDKMHRLAVALISAYTFPAVMHTLGYHLREDFAIPEVAVRLWSLPAGELEALPEFAAVSQELQVYAETLKQPYCGSTAGFETSTWFGEAALNIRSQALIALKAGGGTIGLVALGAYDSERFYAGMGTVYLERLGDMASAAIARTLKTA
ncbi:DUF484 family protein [Azospira restricta]|uniref:DUF484 family protein n=1 Tax=Azospira restricta TaxID=404405 RepID=A0A974Y4V1_9RHOO|nr:DUF484 family protein [Azospira restricta]QRJ64820.1 DUF484 family protein [Azospira restricta]